MTRHHIVFRFHDKKYQINDKIASKTQNMGTVALSMISLIINKLLDNKIEIG